MSSIATLIKCLPIIFGLIKTIQKTIDEQKTNQQVADHLAKVKEAFDAKDSSKLDDIFNH